MYPVNSKPWLDRNLVAVGTVGRCEGRYGVFTHFKAKPCGFYSTALAPEHVVVVLRHIAGHSYTKTRSDNIIKSNFLVLTNLSHNFEL